jgi:O-glycosyl hydrolase
MFVAVFSALLLMSAPPPALADYSVSVNPNSVLVTNFQGWGTSLCWWANVVGGYSNRDTYASLAFSQLKLNIVRYNIGGGENPALTNTITNYRAIMQGFEPTNGLWNWNADANQRWMLRTALSLGANRVVAFANSPPWWMTVSGSVTGGTNSSASNNNNLQTSYEQTFGSYLANVVSNLAILDGVHFDYVTPMNEPAGTLWEYDNKKQEGCDMTSTQQARVASDLRTSLNASGVSAGIDAPEDENEQRSIDDLNGYSSSALAAVTLVTTHTYGANNPSGLQSLANSLGKPLWVSEYGDGDGTGLTMAQRIHDDITGLAAQAWVYWQVVDNASGWGFLYNPLTTNSNGGFTTSYTVNEKFYVMGQFSEFIQPGFQILSVADTNSLVAYNPGNSTLVIVTVNDSANSFNVTYNLGSFGILPAQASVWRTSATEQLAALSSLTVTNNQFTSFMPADSVTTQVLTNAVPGSLTLVKDIAPLSLNLYAGLTNSFSVQVSGTPPISYTWMRNGTRIAGATNSSYSFAVGPGTNNYQCLVTNPQVSVNSSVATVAGVPPPQDAYSLALLADGPLACWRLNEARGTVIAYDYVGGLDGVYGVDTTNGLPGAPAPPFLGFGNDLAVSMDNTVGTVGDGYVSSPGLSLTTNSASILCWAFPYTNQNNPAGLVFLRSGANVFGSQIGGAQYLDYTWANKSQTYDYPSGLVVPTNMWSFLALTITPSNAILYVFNANGQGSATNNFANAAQSFSSGFALGADPQASTLPGRIFNGKMNEVAIFDYPLSAAQLNQLYTLALGGLTLTLQRSGGNFVVSWPFGALQQANSLAGPWAAVPGAASPYTNAPSGQQLFYRVTAQTP